MERGQGECFHGGRTLQGFLKLSCALFLVALGNPITCPMPWGVVLARVMVLMERIGPLLPVAQEGPV